MKNAKVIIVILIIVALFSCLRPSLGCGPFFYKTVFTFTSYPGPLDRFLLGDLGILLPAYDRSYLYAAYRYLIGTGFDQEERAAFTAPLDDGLGSGFGEEPECVQNWLDARNKAPGAGALPAKIKVYEELDEWYSSYLNYSADAFYTAARTLNERIEKFGADSKEVLDWVKAQDMVFSASLDSFVPEPAGADADPLVRADRAYQIAAANFYTRNFDVAEKMFREIANDASSPWRQIAPYLAARALVRKATLNSQPGQIDAANLALAENQLRSVLSDQNLSAIHPPARRLLSFVLFRLRPNETLRQLDQLLLKKNLGGDLKQYLVDYTRLLEKFAGYPDENTWDSVLEKFREFSENDMTDWIITFQADSKGALDHSLQGWIEKSSLPWLIASLSKVGSENPELPELLRAAEKVKQDSPAFLSIKFHVARLLTESGRRDEARKALDLLLSNEGKTFSPSSYNLFLAQRMKVSANLDEFLKYAPRIPVEKSNYVDTQELSINADSNKEFLFDSDSSKIINENMPLSLLKEIAASRLLNDRLRRDIALSAWVRGVLLDDEKICEALIPDLENLVPELKDNLEAYLSAKSSDEKKFSAIFLILKFPGLHPYISPGSGRKTPLNQIDNFRDNWWRPFNPDVEINSGFGYYERSIDKPLTILYPDETKLESPEFLTAEQKSSAQEEWVKLFDIETAPDYLSRHVIEWAEKKPDDPRVPEALHLAVRTTRYGSTDEDTSAFSKQAFQILHKKYPQSEWAIKTKYWY